MINYSLVLIFLNFIVLVFGISSDMHLSLSRLSSLSRKKDFRLKEKITTSKCFIDRNPSTPSIDKVGGIFKHDLPGEGRHITISQYEIRSQATLQNKLQFSNSNNDEWSTVWEAIDFGGSPFLPMNFPSQQISGKWRWYLKCVANCNNAKIYSMNTNYCFHNLTNDKNDLDMTYPSHQTSDNRLLIGGSSSKVGCYKQQVPYPINMNHLGAEYIFGLDGEGKHIRILRYDLSGKSTIEHKLQFWNEGWKTVWSHAAYGVGPSPPSDVPLQNKSGNWRWTLTCISQCSDQIFGLSTDYCLESSPFSLLATSTSFNDNKRTFRSIDDSHEHWR